MSQTGATPKKFSATLDGRDEIEIEINENAELIGLRAVGCTEFLSFVRKLQIQFGKEPKRWPLPNGSSHCDLLIREVLLKIQGKWVFPVADGELCHCRAVFTKRVDQAVLAGAHSVEMISRQTSAGTACGTCRPEIQKVIDYRLQKGAAVEGDEKS